MMTDNPCQAVTHIVIFLTLLGLQHSKLVHPSCMEDFPAWWLHHILTIPIRLLPKHPHLEHSLGYPVQAQKPNTPLTDFSWLDAPLTLLKIQHPHHATYMCGHLPHLVPALTLCGRPPTHKETFLTLFRLCYGLSCAPPLQKKIQWSPSP